MNTSGSTNTRSAVMEAVREWIANAPHGDNCYVSNHHEADPGNQCRCGKESLLEAFDSLSDEPAPRATTQGDTSMNTLADNLTLLAVRCELDGDEHGCAKALREAAKVIRNNCLPLEPAPHIDGRKPGKSKLVYDKATRTIVAVTKQPDEPVAESGGLPAFYTVTKCSQCGHERDRIARDGCPESQSCGRSAETKEPKHG